MKILKTQTIILLFIPPTIIIMDWVMGNSRVISVIENIISPYFSNYNSARYVLSAIIQSVATILTLIFTVSMISLQLFYKHAKIMKFFLKKRETRLLLFFMFSVIFVSTLALSNIEAKEDGSDLTCGPDLTGIIYFFAVYSILLFILPLPFFIYDYWKFCTRFFNSRDLLGLVREEETQDVELLLEILKKALEEGNMDTIREACHDIENIFGQAYQRVIS